MKPKDKMWRKIVTNPNMKRFLIWSLVLAVVGAMTFACDDSEEVCAPVTEPSLSVTCNHTISLPVATATEGVIQYTVVNPHGDMIATAESEAAWIHPALSSEGTHGTNSQGQPTFTATIRYAAAANRGAARTAELVISYGRATPVVLTIRQPQGAGGENEDPTPDPTPDPDPTPTPTPSGKTLMAGWAELPMTVDRSDWHYTYHVPDVESGGSNARNYSVCYSTEMMCAVWVAAPMHDFYAKKNTERTDEYATDPNFNFTQPGKWSGYTRGHLLGSAERLVSRKANQQAFYHSNIAPQSSTYFNTGGGAWNTLEEWVDKQWVGHADTTYQVIGCYWDPAVTPKTVSSTRIPTHYYKVLLCTKNHQNKWVMDCQKEELQCIAVLVEHRTYEKGEVPKPADYEKRGMLLTVKEMEELTGLTFFGNVPNAPKESYSLSDWTF